MNVSLIAAIMSLLPASGANAAPATRDAFMDNLFAGTLPAAAVKFGGEKPVAPAAGAPQPADKLDSRVSALIRLERTLASAPVWPGYSILSQPVLIYEEGKRAFLIAHPNPPADFKRLTDSPYSVSLKEGTLGLNSTMDWHYPLNGADCFAFLYKTGEEPLGEFLTGVRLVVHERFHIFQETAFKNSHRQEDHIIATPETTALVALEQRVLLRVLDAKSINESAHIGRTFAAIRAFRNEKHFADKTYEDYAERAEGPTRYVELKLTSRLPGEGNAVRREVKKDLGSEVRNVYGTGAAQAILLDKHGPEDWKTQVAGGTAMFDLLAALYPMSGQERLALVERAKSELRYDELLLAAKKKFKEFEDAQNKALAAWNSAPGMEVEVNVRPYFTSRGEWYTLENGEVLMKMVRMGLQDEKLQMHGENLPVILGKDKGYVKFHVETSAIALDGAAFAPQDGTYNFKTLSLSDRNASITVSAPGTLVITGKKLKIHVQ